MLFKPLSHIHPCQDGYSSPAVLQPAIALVFSSPQLNSHRPLAIESLEWGLVEHLRVNLNILSLLVGASVCQLVFTLLLSRQTCDMTYYHCAIGSIPFASIFLLLLFLTMEFALPTLSLLLNTKCRV